MCAIGHTHVQINFWAECNQEKEFNQVGFEMARSFDKLKELCNSTPILAYADFGKPFKSHTDASVLGLRLVLYQAQDGVEKVITYASHSVAKSESEYPVHKLEFLHLKWAITDQFHEYLYENTFDVYTDNNPLTHILTTAKLDAMGHKWVAGLANYNFHIHYKSGKSNVEADALSWIDWEKCDNTIQAESIQAIVAAAITGQVVNYIEAIPCKPQIIDSLLPSTPETPIVSKAITQSSGQSHPTHPEDEPLALKAVSKLDNPSHLGNDLDPSLNTKCMTTSDWVEAQSQGENVGEIICLFKTNELQC